MGAPSELDVDARFPARVSRAEWDRRVRAGELEGERVELLRGRVVRVSPLSPTHVKLTSWLTQALVRQLDASVEVSSAGALAVGDDSEPEPDVLVTRADWARREHPRDALLVIEVAVTSLAYDRGPKLEVYAEAGVPEYWIVDASARVVEVYTSPAPASRTYARRVRHGAGESLCPSGLSSVAIAIDDLPW